MFAGFVFGGEVANAAECEQTILDAIKAHVAEAHMGSAASVLSQNDLIGRKRHTAAIGKRDECTARLIAWTGPDRPTPGTRERCRAGTLRRNLVWRARDRP